MVLSSEEYHLVQCPVTPCTSWFMLGAPYKRHLWSMHGEREYLDPHATMVMNPSGLDKLDDEMSTEDDSVVRQTHFVFYYH